MSTTPRLSLDLWVQGITQPSIPVNNSFKRLDATVNLAVISNTLAAQPVSPAAGDAYILPAGVTGTDWAGKSEGTIAYFDGAVWLFVIPTAGITVQVINAGAPFWLRFQSGSWMTESQSLDAELSIVISDTAGTGLIEFNGLTINADTTKFDVGAIDAWFIDNTTDPLVPARARVTFAAQTALVVTNIATAIATYVGINQSGVVIQQVTPFTAIQSRSIIELGVLVHSNNTVINSVSNRPQVALSPANQLHDALRALGSININGGNLFTAAGANLTLAKSAGTLFRLGAGFVADSRNPHTIASGASTPVSFAYRTRSGTTGPIVTSVDPANYDLAGVPTPVPSNNFTIQRVYLFPSGAVRILYGQTLYSTLSAAIAEIRNESFVVDPATSDNGTIRAWIVVRNSTTSLQNASDARIISANRFGL